MKNTIDLVEIALKTADRLPGFSMADVNTKREILLRLIEVDAKLESDKQMQVQLGVLSDSVRTAASTFANWFRG